MTGTWVYIPMARGSTTATAVYAPEYHHDHRAFSKPGDWQRGRGQNHGLGFTAFGAEASELMAVAQTAMFGGIPYTVLGDTIWTHPTTAEGLLGLFASPPSAPGPMQSVSSSSVNGPRKPGAVPATAKE